MGLTLWGEVRTPSPSTTQSPGEFPVWHWLVMSYRSSGGAHAQDLMGMGTPILFIPKYKISTPLILFIPKPQCS